MEAQIEQRLSKIESLLEKLVMPKLDRMLTIDEAAAMLAVSSQTVRREIAAGRLPACRMGRAIRIRPEDLELFEARAPAAGTGSGPTMLDAIRELAKPKTPPRR